MLPQIFLGCDYLKVCLAMKATNDLRFQRNYMIHMAFNPCPLRQAPRPFIDVTRQNKIGPHWNCSQFSGMSAHILSIDLASMTFLVTTVFG